MKPRQRRGFFILSVTGSGALSCELRLEQRGDISFLIPSNLLPEGSVRVAFSTRGGGVSPPPYESLNLAFHVGDEEANVLENRRVFCSVLGLDPGRLTTAQQVHGNKIAVVGQDLVGRGAFDEETAIPMVDGLITNLTGVPLAVFLADCVPIVLFDPLRRAIGIAHAGWKGTYGGIALNLVESLVKVFQSCPENLLAFVGPSIRSCCYEVDAELFQMFKDRFRDEVSERGRLDLVMLNVRQLERGGIFQKNIHFSRLCTACKVSLFFSHRVERQTGRQAAIVALL